MPTTRLDGNPFGALTDVAGVAVGHARRVGDGWLTGCTVVVPPVGTTGGVDVRGGGPATAETDALRPGTVAGRVDAVLMTGGSAYGLAALGGLQDWCELRPRGFRVGLTEREVVPIVPAMALYDLGRGGDFSARPDATMAGQAAEALTTGTVPTGSVGAGTGALMDAGNLKGGVGTGSVRCAGGVVVGALVVVNAAGSPLDPVTGALLAASAVPDEDHRPRVPKAEEHAAAVRSAQNRSTTGAPRNTTLAVVATSARLSPVQATRMAVAGQAGLARSLHPVSTLADGDVVVALATGEHDPAGAADVPAALREQMWPDALAVAGEIAVQSAASTAVALAVLDAVLSATGVRTPAVDVPGYLEAYPSARPRSW